MVRKRRRSISEPMQDLNKAICPGSCQMIVDSLLVVGQGLLLIPFFPGWDFHEQYLKSSKESKLFSFQAPYKGCLLARYPISAQLSLDIRSLLTEANLNQTLN